MVTPPNSSPNPQGHPLLNPRGGAGELILGNDAIVRGAIEAGVAYAAGYPGTPSSEVTDGFAALADLSEIQFEYAVNEKICVELAFGASLAGARSICAMKHLGLMVAGDPISTIPYMGVNGGMVIVSAADPSCLTSPNEQDQRHLGRMLHMPTLDPSCPSEARRLTRLAFEMSEDCQLPILMRVTTRVAHTRARVPFEDVQPGSEKGNFTRDPSRFLPTPTNARRLRRDVLPDRIARARAFSEDLFESHGNGRLAVIMVGAPTPTTLDMLDTLAPETPVIQVKLPCVFPLPETALGELLARVDRVLVVEELSPFVEDQLASLCNRLALRTVIEGKHTDHFPVWFEYEPDVVRRGLERFLGIEQTEAATPAAEAHSDLGAPTPRPPELCSGCPHRSSFFAAKAVFEDDHLYFNDIGCYTLGVAPPLRAGDALLCMGAAPTLAAGVSRVTGERAVSFIGDSTFFHAGMPALLDAIKEDANIVTVILDNDVTAMTGFQESVRTKTDGAAQARTSIEGVVRSLGCQHVERFDPHNMDASLAAFERARSFRGVSVLIAEAPCPVHHLRETGTPLQTRRFTIDQDLCAECGRDSCGMSCGQPPVLATERHMGRNRSLETRTNPPTGIAACAAECPLGICIQGYAGHIAAGEYAMALELILNENPLPNSVCRVCHRPCETACSRGTVDSPVAVNDLKRFVMGWAEEQDEPPFALTATKPHGRKIAIIGAGPAGLSAARDLALRGYEVTVFDREEQPGGLLRFGIPRFRLPGDALDADIRQLKGLGITFQGKAILGDGLSISALLDDDYDAVVLAIGAQQSTTLDLPSTDGAPETIGALSFLRNQSNRAEGKDVVVVGAGNAGVDVARTAIRQGATHVTAIDQQQGIPALQDEAREATAEGVTFRMGLNPVRLSATSGLVCETSEGDDTIEIAADLVIFSVGQTVVSDGLEELDLHWSDNGTLLIDAETGQTSHPLIFAAGDMAPTPRTVTDAMGSGRRAAFGVDAALRGKNTAAAMTPPPAGRPWPETHPAPVAVHRSDSSRMRAAAPHLAPPKRGLEDEVVGALDESSARAEARRCMLCGSCASCHTCIDTFGCPAFIAVGTKVEIDPTLCVGCGDCATFCPNGAIQEEMGGVG